jgi:hypothetical protein
MAYSPTLNAAYLEALAEQAKHNYKWIQYTPLFNLDINIGFDSFILGSSVEDACWMTAKKCDEVLKFVIKRNPNDSLFFERVQLAPEKFAIRVEQRI